MTEQERASTNEGGPPSVESRTPGASSSAGRRGDTRAPAAPIDALIAKARALAKSYRWEYAHRTATTFDRLANALEEQRQELGRSRDNHAVHCGYLVRAETAEQQVAELTKAARWVLHVVNGVGRAGVEPEPGEYEAALDALRTATGRNPR